MKIWLSTGVFLLATAFAAHAEQVSLPKNPITFAYEIENPDLELYVGSVVNVLNVLLFGADPEVPRNLQEREDIVFLSGVNLIDDGEISDAALSLLQSSVTEIISEIEAAEPCIIQELSFPDKNTIFVFHSVEQDVFEPKCFHLALAYYFQLDFEDLQELAAPEALAEILSSLK